MKFTVAVSGLHAGENPQPGPGVIRSLRRRYGGDLTVVGLIYDAFESAVYAPGHADRVYQIPYPSAGVAVLLRRLDQILAEQPIDVLIPTLDAEIQPLIGLEAELAERGVKMLLPTLESFKTRSKDRLAELAAKAGCRTPRYFPVSDASSLLEAARKFTYPMMIKGPYYDAYTAHSEGDLEGFFRRLIGKWGAPVLVQERIVGEEFDIVAVGDGAGGMAGSCPIRKSIVSEKGKGYGGVVAHDEDLDRHGRDLIRTLRWRGPMELEFIRDADSGEFHLIEINPRFPAWVDFPTTIGYNLPALVIEELLEGGMKPLPRCRSGDFFVRHCVDVPGRIEDLGQLTTFGTLTCRSADAQPQGERRE